MDNTCIICLEEIKKAKKLNCGHIFHLNCLRRWLEQNVQCPTCRTKIELEVKERDRDRTIVQAQRQRLRRGVGAARRQVEEELKALQDQQNIQPNASENNQIGNINGGQEDSKMQENGSEEKKENDESKIEREKIA